jgi:hypothetical protein
MGNQRPIRVYEYVNFPYERVRDLLVRDAGGVFHDATKAAASRAEAVVAELRASIGGIEVGTDVAIQIHGIAETPRRIKSPQTTSIQLEWKASSAPRLFPVMRAELTLYPLTATETQLDFSGAYEPPLGPLGTAIDAVIGHKIAEASVHRFVRDVAEHLKRRLGGAQ